MPYNPRHAPTRVVLYPSHVYKCMAYKHIKIQSSAHVNCQIIMREPVYGSMILVDRRWTWGCGLLAIPSTRCCVVQQAESTLCSSTSIYQSRTCRCAAIESTCDRTSHRCLFDDKNSDYRGMMISKSMLKLWTVILPHSLRVMGHSASLNTSTHRADSRRWAMLPNPRQSQRKGSSLS